MNYDQVTSALNHLRSAVALLDVAEAPPEIAARVDYTIHQLEGAMSAANTGTVSERLLYRNEG